MSILTDRVPDCVEIDGRRYDINTDFRIGIRLEMAILEEKLSESLLFDYYPKNMPPDANAAIERLMWFYRCGEDEGKGQGGGGRSGRGYDFEQDSDALYTSFMVAYGIDLATADLHWWVFRKLMWGLPPETPFMQRVHYRMADISDMSKAEQKRYRKMKAAFALRRTAKEKLTLEERNQKMKDYVAKRLSEAQRDKAQETEVPELEK